MASFNELLVIKKSNSRPKEGDIFVLNPKPNVYCFGKVIKTDIESRDSFVNGMILIFIYDYFSNTEIVPPSIESKKILLVEVINQQLWRKGYAKNVAFSEVSNQEINEDFAFWDILREEYVDLKGKRIGRVPKYKGVYGLGSYGVVGKDIKKAIDERGL